jgi:hypothetical protein
VVSLWQGTGLPPSVLLCSISPFSIFLHHPLLVKRESTHQWCSDVQEQSSVDRTRGGTGPGHLHQSRNVEVIVLDLFYGQALSHPTAVSPPQRLILFPGIWSTGLGDLDRTFLVTLAAPFITGLYFECIVDSHMVVKSDMERFGASCTRLADLIPTSQQNAGSDMGHPTSLWIPCRPLLVQSPPATSASGTP